MGVFAFRVLIEILSGGVVVPALDLAIAFAHGRVNGLAGVAVEVEREGVFRLAGGAGVSGRLPLVGLQIGPFVNRHKKRLFLKLHFIHFVHRVGQVRLLSRTSSFTESGKFAYRVGAIRTLNRRSSFLELGRFAH